MSVAIPTTHPNSLPYTVTQWFGVPQRNSYARVRAVSEPQLHILAFQGRAGGALRPSRPFFRRSLSRPPLSNATRSHRCSRAHLRARDALAALAYLTLVRFGLAAGLLRRGRRARRPVAIPSAPTPLRLTAWSARLLAAPEFRYRGPCVPLLTPAAPTGMLATAGAAGLRALPVARGLLRAR